MDNLPQATPPTPSPPLVSQRDNALPQADSPQPPRNPPAKSVSPKRGMIILAIVIGVIILASAAGAVFFLQKKTQSPEFLFLGALQNLLEIRSGNVTGDIDIRFDFKPPPELLEFQDNPDIAVGRISPFGLIRGDTEPTTIHLDIDLGFNRIQDEFTQFATDLILKIPTGEIPFIGKISISPELSIVMADETEAFIKFSGIPSLIFFDLEKLQDQWIKIDFKRTEEDFGYSIDLEEQRAKQKHRNELSISTYIKYPFIIFESLGSENVEGISSHHMSFSLDKEKLKEYEMQYNLALVAEDLRQSGRSQESINEKIDSIEVSGEFWIGKDNNQFTKEVIHFESNTDSFEMVIDTTAVLTNHNGSVEITTPTDFITDKEAFGRMESGSMFGSGSGLTASRDVKRIADIKQIQTALELYFNDQVAYPLPPIGGNRLGVDATCLDATGFGLVPTCSNPYMGLIPMDIKSPEFDYTYYSCGPNEYIIEFFLEEETSGIPAGLNHATPNGFEIDQPILEIPQDCLDQDADGLPNYLETQHGSDPNQSDTDGDGFGDGMEVLNGFSPTQAGS